MPGRVYEAADGQQAVEAARSQCPDLILMDLNLPGVEGVEATRIIREMRGPCGVVPVGYPGRVQRLRDQTA